MCFFFLFCFVFGGRGISNELGGLPVVYLHGNAHDFLKKWMAPKQTTTTFQKPAGRMTFYKDFTKYERSTSLKESWHFKTFKKKKKQIWKSELSHDCLQRANQQCTVEICDSYEHVARSISTLFQSEDESQCNLSIFLDLSVSKVWISMAFVQRCVGLSQGRWSCHHCGLSH